MPLECFGNIAFCNELEFFKINLSEFIQNWPLNLSILLFSNAAHCVIANLSASTAATHSSYQFATNLSVSRNESFAKAIL